MEHTRISSDIFGSLLFFSSKIQSGGVLTLCIRVYRSLIIFSYLFLVYNTLFVSLVYRCLSVRDSSPILCLSSISLSTPIVSDRPAFVQNNCQDPHSWWPPFSIWLHTCISERVLAVLSAHTFTRPYIYIYLHIQHLPQFKPPAFPFQLFFLFSLLFSFCFSLFLLGIYL